MEKIDFVITWVDGTDPTWLAEKRKYERLVGNMESQSSEANSDCRYRDLGGLRYWFRSVECYAPWVNKIYFITCGQKPAWLNSDHPKLVCIDHQDYIPKQYLPTFNSNTIELNLHRIDNLSEKFVLFNDDIFLTKPVLPDFFYHNGNPVLISTLRYPDILEPNNWGRVAYNDYCIVNRYHDISSSIWKNRSKWFCISELELHRAIRNLLCYIANKSLPVSSYGHIAQPHLKSTWMDVWNKCPETLDRSCIHKFRSDEQVNQWLFCAWNQALGKFYPGILNNRGTCLHIYQENLDKIIDLIIGQRLPLICLNDSLHTKGFEECAESIISAFQRALPNKSEFEIG